MDTGYYYLFLRGVNGCLSVDTAYIDNDPPHPVFSLETDTITCYIPSVPVIIHSADSLEKFEWTGPGNTGQERDFMTNLGGWHFINVFNEYGCATLDSINVPIDTSSPVITITTMDSVLCNHRIISLTGNDAPVGEQYEYSWHTDDGEIISGLNEVEVIVKDTGTYKLTEINLRNGCSNTQSFRLTEKPNRLYTILSTVDDADCIGVNNGSITIDGVPLATGNLEFSIIPGVYTSNNYYNQLSPGDYTIMVIDDYGCTYDTIISVGIKEEVTVSLGNDTSILLGEKILIDPSFSVDESMIQILNWINAPDPCSTCPYFEDSPAKSITYKISVMTLQGCIAEDERKVFVSEESPLFVPDAFTPNGDGTNDKLWLSSAPSILKIERFEIFDRWGNHMYGVQNVDPNNSDLGWDGKFRGHELNAAVFVYFVEFMRKDGTRGIMKGNFTLIR